MHRRRLAAGVVAVAMGIAAHAAGQTPTSQPRLSSDWKRVQSRNFVVVGDTSERQLRSTARDLEAFRHAMITMFPALDVPAPVPTTFILFKNVNAFRPFAPRDGRGRPQPNIAGYFTSGPEARYMVAYAMPDGQGTLGVIYHEYAHSLLHQSGRRIPTWVDEGLAEFYSTFRSTATGAIVGEPERGRLGVVASGEPLLSFEEMFTSEGVARTFRNDVQMHRFYAQAWTLVHYSLIGDRRGQLSDYLQAVSRGASPADAFASAYKTSFTDLILELRRYSRRPVLQMINVRLPDEAEATIGPAQRMSEVEALTVQAALLVRDEGAEGEAAAAVTKALAVDPDHVGVRVLQAILDDRAGRSAEAIATLQQVVADVPQLFAAKYFLAATLSGDGQAEAAVRAWGDAVDLNPQSADAWAQLSVAAGLLNRNAQASAALSRALVLEPDAKWYALRAHRLFGRNDPLVIADAGAFVRERTLGDEQSPYMAFLAAMAAMRMRDPDAVGIILGPVGASLDAKTWPHAVTQFLIGKLASNEFLTRASTPGERTEAHAYIGIVASIAGRMDEAQTHLTWVRDRGERNYTEYRLAVEELERLTNVTH